jgi:hypothetical protein
MPTLRIPVQIVYSASGGPGVNIWHFRSGQGQTTPNSAGTALGILNTFYTAIKPLYQVGTHIISPVVVTTTGDNPEYVSPSASSAFDIVGSGGTGQAAQALAITVSWYTSSATRSGRGRTFLGPLSSGAIGSDGLPAAGNLATLRSAASQLVSTSKGLTTEGAFVVYSTKQNIARDFDSARVRNFVSVLRSRRD